MILIVILCIFISKVHAAEGIEGILQTADDFLNLGKEESDGKTDKAQLQNMVDLVYNTFLGVGVFVAVVVGAILGIKYMTTASEEQAKIKETFEPYIIGCIVTFGAFGVWKIAILLLRQV